MNEKDWQAYDEGEGATRREGAARGVDGEKGRLAQIRRLRSEVTWLHRCLAERNRQLDAMAWVWSPSPRIRSAFRFLAPLPPLAPDEGLVEIMQANVNRLRRLVRSRRFPKFWATLDAEARAKYGCMVQSERDAWASRVIQDEAAERAADQQAAAQIAASGGRVAGFPYDGSVRCPFCEGQPYVSTRPNPERVPDEPGEVPIQWCLVCSSCAAEGPWARTRARAISLWENRPSPPERALLRQICGLLRAWRSSLPPRLYERLLPILEEAEEKSYYA